MNRIRPLLAASIAALATMLALAGTASANDSIYGAYVQFSSNAAGNFDAFHYAHSGGGGGAGIYNFSNAQGDGDAGITLAVYSGSGASTTATTYGVHAAHPFTTVTVPTLQPGGNGTAAHPYVLQSEYYAGAYDTNGVCQGNPCLRVTELAEYHVDAVPSQAEDDVYLTYHVANEGDAPAKFRLTLAADTDQGSSNDDGTGFFDAIAPRAVGTDSPGGGNAASFQEVGASSFTHYQEGLPFAIWRKVQNPLDTGGVPSAGLNDTVTSTNGDKAMAVQWDDFLATGLAASSGHDFQIFLHFVDYDALALSNPGNVVTDTNKAVTVVATARNRLNQAVTLQAQDIHYRVYGGPDAPNDQSWLTQAPEGGDASKADLTWHWLGDGSKPAATDRVEVWADLNHDGVMDPNEPHDYRYVNWFDAFSIYTYSDNDFIGEPGIFHVDARDPNTGNYTTRNFKWKVTGANPLNPAPDADGLTPCTGGCSSSDVDLATGHAGTDTVEVWEDIDGDTFYNGYGEKRTIKFTWFSGLDVVASSAAIVKDSAYSVTARLRDVNYNAVTGVSLHYTIDGGVEQTTAPTVAGPSYGSATIPIPTGTVGDRHLVVWQESGAHTGFQPAEDVTNTSNDYAVYLAPDQRLTTDADADPSGFLTRTAGNAVNLGVVLKKADGSADTTHKLRYYVYYNSIDSTNDDELSLPNDGTGHFAIPLADLHGQTGEDEVALYADYNDNGTQDSNEPSDDANVQWYRRAQLYQYNANHEYQPDPAYTAARLQHANGSPYVGTYDWWVDGGPHTQGTSTGSSLYNASFSVPSQSAGPHTIHVSFHDPTDNSDNSDTSQVTWYSKDNLVLARNFTNASTGATAQVTATLTNSQTGLPVPAGTVIRYQISGYNEDGGKQAVETNASGQAVIKWVGTTAGTDYVYAWPDYDADGVQDPNEYDTEEYTPVTFHDRVELDGNFLDKAEGNTQQVTVTFHDDAYNPLTNQPLAWQISGANPQTGTVTTNGSGVANVQWTGNEPGSDNLIVWQDSDADGQIDPDEKQSTPLYVYWYQRVNAFVTSGCCTKVAPATFNITANVDDLNGANAPGVVLHWIATGANPGSGNATANASGTATFDVPGTNGGNDQVVVFIDKNGNGTRETGEPQDMVSIYWTSTVQITSCTTSKPEGTTQTIIASKSGAVTNPLRYEVLGKHPVASTAYPAGGFLIDGPTNGYDSVVVWADDGDNVRESGEPQAWCGVTWTPRIQLTGGDGYRVAGGSVSVLVQMLNSSGTPDTTPNVALHYTVTGANPHGDTVVHTNSQGKATVTYTSDLQGTDTVSVTDGTFTSTRSVYWAAPPVSLSISHNTANDAFQTTSHTVTAHIAGITIPPAGFPVHFSVSGANTASQVVQSDASGNAQFTWTGAQDGSDTVFAYAELSGSGSYDGYDPSSSTTMKWEPLVVLSSTTSDQGIGEAHTETLHFVNNTGGNLANADVWYQISGANPTGGIQQARELTGSTGSRIQARTDASGNVPITWTGTNTGTDTLDAWGDSNLDTVLQQATDAHASKVVTWRAATASVNLPGGGGTTPIANQSAVTPGSANDFDGVLVPTAPVVAKSVNVAPVSGHVFVKLPGKKVFIELLDAEQIPVGSIVDVRKGRVALTSAQNLKGGVATAEFYSGEFQIAQKKATKPVTELDLFGGSFGPCSKILKKSSSAGIAQKKKVRELWGKGKGLFRTKGKYASAAIRGTNWDVVDYCDGTLVKVAQGVVEVDPIRGKNKIVKAPKSFFVPAKAPKHG